MRYLTDLATVAVMVVWLWLFVLLSFAAGDDTIPFKRDGVYLAIPVHFEANGIVRDVYCDLDTAAQGFWVNPAFASELNLPYDTARISLFPPIYLPYVSVGTKQYWNKPAKVWEKLSNKCLVGMDPFWMNYTQFDFVNSIITTSNNPSEFWQGQWGACKADRDAWMARAYWDEGRIWSLLLRCGARCSGY